MAKLSYDVIIIGSGVAGLAAAMYAGRLHLNTLVIGNEMGGTINFDYNVENYPGFTSIKGFELAKKIKEQAFKYKPKIINEIVTEISKNKNYIVNTKNKYFEAKTIIIATGREEKTLNIPGEKKFMHKGVHSCAICDAAFYKNKTIGVIGGSDSAAKEALILTKYAKKVYIIYRGEQIHPEPVYAKRINEEKNKIEIINNTNITEIKGNKFVNKVVLDRSYKNSKELKLDAVFIGIGHTPTTELVKSLKVKLNKKGEIIVNKNAETNVKGVYAAGDVTDNELKQIVVAVSYGVIAAYNAYKYINENKFALNP